MIDYLSLALGHGLLAVALLRLVLLDDLDVDPRVKEHKQRAEAERSAATNSGRASQRMKAQETASERDQDEAAL